MYGTENMARCCIDLNRSLRRALFQTSIWVANRHKKCDAIVCLTSVQAAKETNTQENYDPALALNPGPDSALPISQELLYLFRIHRDLQTGP